MILNTIKNHFSNKDETFLYNYDKDHDFIFCISDLHILHKNIILYNFETRKKFLDWKKFEFLKSWNNEENKKFLWEYLNELSNENSEELNKLLIDISRNLIEFLTKEVLKFYENITKNNHNVSIKNLYYIDQWDLFFHLTKTKIQILKDYWLYEDIKNYFKLLQTLWFKRLLTLWNHDNYFWTHWNIKKSDQQVSDVYSFYNEFFDNISRFFIFVDEKNNIVQSFTHFPLNSLLHNFTSDKWDKLFLSQNNYFDIIIPKTFLELFENDNNIQFIMNYWHVHHRNLINEYIWKKHKQKIDYSDYIIDKFNLEIFNQNTEINRLIEKEEFIKIIDFFNNHVELKCHCFDHIYDNNKNHFNHVYVNNA